MIGPGRDGALPWDRAWQHALYGPHGFYRQHGWPAEHFRTAAHADAAALARAMVRLARTSGCERVVDVGAGAGEVLGEMALLSTDLQLVGVDLRERPHGLHDAVEWRTETTGLGSDPTTLLMGWELLDVVACPVLEADDDGELREVIVDRLGREHLSSRRPGTDDLAWCARWWPGPYEPGDRVEVGAPRDRQWEQLVRGLVGVRGLALAVDYDHLLATRPPQGSLVGYRRGRRTPPIPDAHRDLSAHVALDAVAHAIGGGTLLRQHVALRRLGVDSPAELLDPGALGAFGWLLSPLGEQAQRAVDALVEQPPDGAKWT